MKKLLLIVCLLLLLFVVGCGAKPGGAAASGTAAPADLPTLAPEQQPTQPDGLPSFPPSDGDLPVLPTQTEAPTDATALPGPDDTAAPPENEAEPLLGVWRNEGQYTEGRDFVETLTMNADGSCTVHLDYRGADYQTLQGVWFAADGMLVYTLEDPSGPVERSFLYTINDGTLVLDNGAKIVSYERVG